MSKFINKYILTERDRSIEGLIKSTKKPSKQFIEKNKKYYGGFKGKVANSFLEKNMRLFLGIAIVFLRHSIRNFRENKNG